MLASNEMEEISEPLTVAMADSISVPSCAVLSCVVFVFARIIIIVPLLFSFFFFFSDLHLLSPETESCLVLPSSCSLLRWFDLDLTSFEINEEKSELKNSIYETVR